MPGGQPVGVSTFGSAAPEIVAECGGYSVFHGRGAKCPEKCPEIAEMHTSVHAFTRIAVRKPKVSRKVSKVARMGTFGHLSTRLAVRKIEVSRKVSRNPARFRAHPRACGEHAVYGC